MYKSRDPYVTYENELNGQLIDKKVECHSKYSEMVYGRTCKGRLTKKYQVE